MAIVKTPARNPVEGASKNEKTSDGVDSEGNMKDGGSQVLESRPPAFNLNS